IRVNQLKGSKNWASCMRLGSGLANWSVALRRGKYVKPQWLIFIAILRKRRAVGAGNCRKSLPLCFCALHA
ncbi:MAG: hypothetical protein WBL48_09935, partial [Pseudolabrys sp.]